MWAGQAADTRIVTPAYFNTMRIRLLEGRVFTAQDTLERPLCVVVDDMLARKMWPGQSALASLVLGAVALLATYLPSYRAANLDPVTALRNEGQ